jgi:hypothetical protein
VESGVASTMAEASKTEMAALSGTTPFESIRSARGRRFDARHVFLTG